MTTAGRVGDYLQGGNFMNCSSTQTTSSFDRIISLLYFDEVLFEEKRLRTRLSRSGHIGYHIHCIMPASRLPSLNCRICLELLDDPKLLECAHTFCNKCLKSTLKDNEIKCPLCRDVTPVKDGDISKLRTNVTLSSVLDDMKTITKCNANVDITHQEIAVYFCRECTSYFCAKCLVMHNQLKRRSLHEVLTIEEYKQQTLVDNTGEDHETALLCVDCNRYVSNSFIDRFHGFLNHTVVTESKYISDIRSRAKQLQKEVTETLEHIIAINNSYANLEEGVRSFSDNMISEINKGYGKRQLLQDRKFTLTKHCQILQENVTKKYEETERKSKTDVNNLVRLSNLVGSEWKNGHNITALAEVCDNLSKLISTVNERACDVSLEEDMRVACSMSFHGNQDSHDNGDLKFVTWQSSKHVLREGKSMTAVDTNEAGCIAVGYFEGGVEFHEDGKDRGIVLEDTGVLSIAFLRDGFLVLLDIYNYITLFSTEMEPQDNVYETLTYDKGGDGCLAIDNDDHIYVSYRSNKNVHIFHRKGGKVIRDIDCLAYTPQQIAVLNQNHVLVMDGSFITKFTNEGPITKVVFQGCHGYPCVSSDGSVLVAWVDRANSILRIYTYTDYLKVVRCVYISTAIDLSGREWYFLRELPCGNFVFCTNTHFIILKRKLEDFDFDWTMLN